MKQLALLMLAILMLGRLPRGVVDDKDIGRRIRMIPAPDSPMLEFDTAYVIGLYVQDLSCWSTNVQWQFSDKTKALAPVPPLTPPPRSPLHPPTESGMSCVTPNLL